MVHCHVGGVNRVLERATRIVLEYGMRYPRLIGLLLTARQPASGALAFLRARVDEWMRTGAAPSIGARWDGCSPRTRATSRCATESRRGRCRPAAAAGTCGSFRGPSRAWRSRGGCHTPAWAP